MIDKIKKVGTPLTIIAIFAAIAEFSGTVALGLVGENLQAQFIWFVMLFPVLLVLLFFITLNFNPKVLYSPGDFADENNFMAFNQVIEAIEVTNTQMLESIEKDEEVANKRKDMSEKFVASFSRGNIQTQKGLWESVKETKQADLLSIESLLGELTGEK